MFAGLQPFIFFPEPRTSGVQRLGLFYCPVSTSPSSWHAEAHGMFLKSPMEREAEKATASHYMVTQFPKKTAKGDSEDATHQEMAGQRSNVSRAGKDGFCLRPSTPGLAWQVTGRGTAQGSTQGVTGSRERRGPQNTCLNPDNHDSGQTGPEK